LISGLMHPRQNQFKKGRLFPLTPCFSWVDVRRIAMSTVLTVCPVFPACSQRS
jgi:hypothetical protein